MTHSPHTPPAPPRTQQLRYVVLRHDGGGGTVDGAGGGDPHWDLMLEVAGQEKLATWQVRVPPESWTSSPAATRIADHRRIYLHYQGPISQNRGTVQRVAAGTWSLLAQTPASRRIQLAGDITLTLDLPENPLQA